VEPELLSIEQVAQRLGLSRSKTYELAASGDLPTVRVGGVLRVRRATLEAWVGDLPEGRSAPASVEFSNEPEADVEAK